MEKVEKNREILAWIALGAAVVAMLSAFTSIEAYKESFPEEFKPKLSVLARQAAPRFAPITALMLAAFAAWLCTFWRQPSKNAKIINLVGLVVTGLGALLHMVFTFIGMGDTKGMTVPTDLLALLANLAMLAILAGVFYLGFSKFESTATGPYGAGQPTMMGQPGVPGQPGQQPTWQPNEAAGGAWNRAGDAATGAGAANWGVPGQQSQGWQPSASPQPSAAEPQNWGQQQPSAAPAQDWGAHQGQPSAAPAPQNQLQSSGWAPAADEGEGTVLRPNPNQQWRPIEGNDDQRQ